MFSQNNDSSSQLMAALTGSVQQNFTGVPVSTGLAAPEQNLGYENSLGFQDTNQESLMTWSPYPASYQPLQMSQATAQTHGMHMSHPQAPQPHGMHMSHPQAPAQTHIMHMSHPQAPQTHGMHMSQSQPQAPSQTHGMHMSQPQAPDQTHGMHMSQSQAPDQTHGMHNMSQPQAPDQTHGMHMSQPEAPAQTHGMHMSQPQTPALTHDMHMSQPEAPAQTHGMHMSEPPAQTHCMQFAGTSSTAGNPEFSSNEMNHLYGLSSYSTSVSAPDTFNDMQESSDDQDLLHIAQQIANQNSDNFGSSHGQDAVDDPLLWNTLSSLPQRTTGYCDLGSDFEDICKEQLLPISSTTPSFVSSPDQLMTSAVCSSLTQPACPTAQTAHIDGIKSMFRLLDLPSQDNTFSGTDRSVAQGSGFEQRQLSKPLKKDIPCTVVSNADADAKKAESDTEAAATASDDAPVKRPVKFHVDKSRLHEVAVSNQSSELAGLGLTVYNQDELEQDIIAQVDDAIEAEEAQRKKMTMQKEMNAVKDDIKSCLTELQKSEKVLDMLKGGKNTMNKDVKRRIISVRNQMDQKLKQLDKLRAKKKSLLRGHSGLDDSMQEGSTLSAAESQDAAMQAMIGLDVDDKIRKGEMTPFGTVMDFAKKKREEEKKQPTKVFLSKDSPFDKYLLDQETRNKKVKTSSLSKPSSESKEPEPKKDKKDKKSKHKSVKHKKESQIDPEEANRFDSKDKRRYRPHETDFSNYRPSKRSSFSRLTHNFSGDGQLSDHECGDEDEMYDEHLHNDDDEYVPDAAELPDSDEDKEWTGENGEVMPKRMTKLKRKKQINASEDFSTTKKKKSVPLDKLNSRDDGNIDSYKARLQAFAKVNAKKRYEKIQGGDVDSEDESDVELDGGFSVPGRVWSKLYPFQKTGVRWLWELHGQQAGGIVGDEMGLGKTIQVVSFLAGLAHSNLKDSSSKYRGLGPCLVVVPTTVMHQWVKEFHKWVPRFRVSVLHNTGSYTSSEESLVQSVFRSRGVLVTAYSSVVIYQEILLRYDWHYVILDEGHKIRNPDAQVTVACKQFRTCHRIILSGSPIQNNLKELWSLFDFVFPGKLGTLPDFMAHFSVPIVQGGYSNATQVQVQTAFKCASVLRDTINPYLLRRMKNDVKENLQLPEKNEQVLFCRLTDHQRDTYQEYLDSRECQEILRGNFMVFPGLITLRKICNHPDLSTGGVNQFDADYNAMTDDEKEFGFAGRSGKMMVVASLLKLWHKQEHRVLVFSQGTQMLNILERQVKEEGYTYMRMDGGTSIGARQGMVDKFNDSPDIFIFLLTTRVGGLGVNLCGANRVLLFDPDWNPSTDMQARERAWRIGQTRQVTIYRLLTTGTIEEKIYHRQIFKQFLTNRVLKDPKQRRFFKSNDLFELFTLSSDDPNHGTETGAIFAGTGSEVAVKPKKVHRADRKPADHSKKNRFDEMKANGVNTNFEIDCDDEEKKNKELQERLEKMREFARKLSQKMEKEKVEQEKVKEDGSEHEVKVEDGEITESMEASLDSTKTNDDDKCSVSETAVDSSRRKHKKHHKEKKSRKHKREKRKDVKFEGETISHLSKHTTFKSAETENEKKKDDDYVLQSLFKKSGVHSALQHDTIMMSSNPDFALVECEAERVAKEAAAALKKSRARCYTARSGIPTWTGQSGKTVSLTAATPKPRFGQKKNPLAVEANTKPKEEKTDSKPKAEKETSSNMFDGTVAGNVKTDVTGSASLTVMNSTELMQRMRKRNYHSTPPAAAAAGDQEEEAPDVSEETMDFITDIRNFIAFQSQVNGQATTQELLDEFSSKIPSSDSAKFKAMLKEICVFRRSDGVGMWRLRPEFR